MVEVDFKQVFQPPPPCAACSEPHFLILYDIQQTKPLFFFYGWGRWRAPTPHALIRDREKKKLIRQRPDTQRRRQRWWQRLTVGVLCTWRRLASPISPPVKSRTHCRDGNGQLTLDTHVWSTSEWPMQSLGEETYRAFYRYANVHTIMKR